MGSTPPATIWLAGNYGGMDLRLLQATIGGLRLLSDYDWRLSQATIATMATIMTIKGLAPIGAGLFGCYGAGPLQSAVDGPAVPGVVGCYGPYCTRHPRKTNRKTPLKLILRRVETLFICYEGNLKGKGKNRLKRA